MAEHDLTALLAAQMDRHLVFPLLEFLQERQLYSEPEILEAKIRLLSGTNMVDYAMDIHKSLHGTDDVPEDMVRRRAEVVSRLRSLEEAAAPLVTFLQNPQLVQELRPDKQYNIHMLQERYQNFSSPLNQLQNRIWLMHWALFIFFNHENGRNGIIDLFFQDRYLNAIQTNAHHLLRYLATAVVVNKRRRNMLKELIKVIQQEQNSYKDPITEFLECLYVNYDFDGAQQKLMECEQKLNMTYDEAELWIMNLVRSSKLDARIDSVSGTLIMTTNQVNVHEQIIESLKGLNMRTYMLAKNIVEPAQAAQQATR
ncbi:hypothetical protein HU200_040810 [Digitaria exilis]|uniref:Eukaryotic translation initiation factor 3 subunit E N-terminal domain-containing protein n=1 Tax=Digitaria exilis TaxID=1010633 RepID=A0A835EI43_9POAL|nr:hypothetical protein HU200_040810 [Digitaria exilis]